MLTTLLITLVPAVFAVGVVALLIGRAISRRRGGKETDGDR